MGFIYGALRMANDYLSTAAKISVRADANDTIVAAETKARREELEIAQDRFSAAVHMVAFFRQNWKCVPAMPRLSRRWGIASGPLRISKLA